MLKVRPIISSITQDTRLESGSRISMECLLVWNWPVVHHFAKRKAALVTTANFVKAERLGDDDENDDEHHCTEECSWLGAKQNQARIHNCATRLAQIGYHTVVRRCTVARKQQRTADCALGVESGHKSCVGICNRPDLPDCAFSFAPCAPPFHNCSPALQHKEKPVLLLKISEKRHSLISCLRLHRIGVLGNDQGPCVSSTSSSSSRYFTMMVMLTMMVNLNIPQQ